MTGWLSIHGQPSRQALLLRDAPERRSPLRGTGRGCHPVLEFVEPFGNLGRLEHPAEQRQQVGAPGRVLLGDVAAMCTAVEPRELDPDIAEAIEPANAPAGEGGIRFVLHMHCLRLCSPCIYTRDLGGQRRDPRQDRPKHEECLCPAYRDGWRESGDRLGRPMAVRALIERGLTPEEAEEVAPVIIAEAARRAPRWMWQR